MSVSSKFALLFKLTSNGHSFDTQVKCPHITAACAKIESMRTGNPPAELSDAVITLKLNGADDELDYESRELYARFVRDFLKLAPGLYYEYSLRNGIASAMNSWDQYTEAMEDGLSLHWRNGFSVFDLETTMAKLMRFVEALLQMQKLAYFQRVEHCDMDEDDLWDSEEVPLVTARRVEWLCEAGCWPVAEETGEPIPEIPSEEPRDAKRAWPAIPVAAIAELLEPYRTAEIPEHYLLP